jgi:LysR family glycine cleavage system transcriptional activator
VLDDLLAGRLVLPFARDVRSRASYHLVCAASPPPSVALVQGWLMEQAAGFRGRRDAFLEALTCL